MSSLLPDDRIDLQPPLIDFTDVGTTGQAHDTFPQPGQARFDWMRSYLIGLLSNQSSFNEPIEFRVGSVWFDLNTRGFQYRTPGISPIFTTEGENWVSLSNGIVLATGLTLQQWFEQGGGGGGGVGPPGPTGPQGPVGPQGPAGSGTDKFAATRIVSLDPTAGTDLTIQAAINNLPAAGGVIFVREGTYPISSSIVMPNKPCRIVGAQAADLNGIGTGVTLDIGSNVIALFTIGFDQPYGFEDFGAKANSLAGQILWHITSNGTTGWNFAITANNITSGRTVAGMDSDKGFQTIVKVDPGQGTTTMHYGGTHILPIGIPTYIIDGPGDHILYNGFGAVAVDAAGNLRGGGFLNSPDLDISNANVGGEFGASVGAIVAFRMECLGWTGGANAFLVNSGYSRITCSVFNDIALTIAGVAFIGSNLSLGTAHASPDRWIDIQATADLATFIGCTFGGSINEQIRTAASNGQFSSLNFNATGGEKTIHETGSANNNRIHGCQGFTSGGGPVIIGPDTVVEGVRRKDVVGGTTTDSFVDQFTHLNDKGLAGAGSIKNTGGSNTLTIRITATDAYGTTDTQVADVLPGAATAWSMLNAVGTALPTYVSYAVGVKSTSSGNSTAFTLHHATTGAY
jgi:hypothetical protein